MHITGEKVYSSRLDKIKLVAFLREQGMSEVDITDLRIRFVRRVRFWFRKKWDGFYTEKEHTITLITQTAPRHFAAYTETSQKEILFELNEVLMHEIQHALERGKDKDKIFAVLLVFVILLYAFLITFNWLLFRGTLVFYVAFIPLVLFAVWAPRLKYQIDPKEKRARAFEKEFGRRHLLFRW